MNEFLCYSLMTIIYVIFILTLILIPYSIYKFHKRMKNNIYISKFFLYFGYFCVFIYLFIFVYTVLMKKTVTLNSDGAFIGILCMLFYSILGDLLLWVWSHYSIEILEDRFVYSHLIYGKEIIYFNEIDILNSKYLFVFTKGKRDFGHEVLELKLKNGKTYNFRLDMFLQGGDSLLMTNTIIFKLKIKREKVYK